MFGTAQVATRSSDGCERTVPLTSTSIFGIVYEASPRTVVSNGSASWQLRRSLIFSAPVDVGRRFAGVLHGPAGLRPELQCQSLAKTRIQCEVDAVPVVGALRAEVRFERDVVLRGPVRGRIRHHQQRYRVAAAVRQTRVLRRDDRELLIVPGVANRVVGDLDPLEPSPVVGDIRRYARDHLLLQR